MLEYSGSAKRPLRIDKLFGSDVIDRKYDIETQRTTYRLADGRKYHRYYDEDHFYPSTQPARSARKTSVVTNRCPGCGYSPCEYNCYSYYEENGVDLYKSTLGFDHLCSLGKCRTCRRKPEKCQCGAYVSFELQRTKERLREHARLKQAQLEAKAEADHICNLLEQIRHKTISSTHDSILDDFDRRWRAEIEKKNIGRVVQAIALEIARITAQYREASAIHAMREFETQGRFIQAVYGKSSLETEIDAILAS
jgi:hypothetical protein